MILVYHPPKKNKKQKLFSDLCLGCSVGLGVQAGVRFRGGGGAGFGFKV